MGWGGGVHVARRNFKMSRAGVYKLMLVAYCLLLALLSLSQFGPGPGCLLS